MHSNFPFAKPFEEASENVFSTSIPISFDETGQPSATFDQESKTYKEVEITKKTKDDRKKYNYFTLLEKGLTAISLDERENKFKEQIDSHYDTLTRTTTYELPEDQDILIIVLNRFGHSGKAGATGNKVKAKFEIQQECYGLYLEKIIVHSGNTLSVGHYVVFFKCEGQWYLYDDTQMQMEFIGTFEDVLNHSRKVSKNCTTLFYQKLHSTGPARRAPPLQRKSMMIDSSSSSSSDIIIDSSSSSSDIMIIDSDSSSSSMIIDRDSSEKTPAKVAAPIQTTQTKQTTQTTTQSNASVAKTHVDRLVEKYKEYKKTERQATAAATPTTFQSRLDLMSDE